MEPSELKPELEMAQVPKLVPEQRQAQVLAQEREREREQASALETMVALLRRATPCLGHRPPEAQRLGDDQTLRHRPDQRPRTRTYNNDQTRSANQSERKYI